MHDVNKADGSGKCIIRTKARWQYEVEGVLLERSPSVSRYCTIGKVNRW